MLNLGRMNVSLAINVQNEEEKSLLKQELSGAFFLKEAELAKSMSIHILERFGVVPKIHKK